MINPRSILSFLSGSDHRCALGSLIRSTLFLFAISAHLVCSASAPSGSVQKIDSLALALADLPQDSSRISVLLLMASVYEDSNPDTSLLFMEDALKVAEEIQSLDQIALLKLRMANIYTIKGQSDRSAELIFEALEIAKKEKNARRIGQAYQTLGMNYGMNGDLENAIHYTKEALAVYDSAGNTEALFPCLQNLMIGSGYIGDLAAAEGYFHRSLQYLDSVYVFNAISGAYAGIASIYQRFDEFEKAAKYYRIALRLNEDTNGSYMMGAYNIQIAKNFRLSGQPDSAKVYLLNSLDINDKLGSLPGMYETTYELAMVHEDLGMPSAALSYFKKYDVLRDSFLAQDKIKRIHELEIKYETEKKEQENKILSGSLDVERLKLARRNGLVAILLLSIVLILVIVIFFLKRLKLKAESDTLRLEQKVLRSQMNPHFVFNALVSIQQIVYKSDRLLAVTNIAIFAKLMRRVLDQSTRESINLRDEIETLKLYVALEALRFEERFDYNIEADPNMNLDQLLIPPMLIQPFVENAIKHGLLNREPIGGTLNVSFSQDGEQLQCRIQDDGVGRKRASEIREMHNPTHRSYGSKSVERRISLLNRRRRADIQIDIQDLINGNQPEGTLVKISMLTNELG